MPNNIKNNKTTNPLAENWEKYKKIIKARQEGELLIFCGAGISAKRCKNGEGLPLFNGLVSDIAKDVFNEKHEKGEFEDKKLQDLINKDLYDRAINYLLKKFKEKDIKEPENELKKYLEEKLFKNKDEVCLLRHKKILELATLKEKLRLVTTNFDNLFELAEQELNYNKNIHFYHAPNIPHNANPAYWSGVIKLHGSVNQENSQLVLSSSDFGVAYLKEGYSRGFLVDMFNKFTIVFIGYSMSDPIFRYIFDAINIEKERDNIYIFKAIKKDKKDKNDLDNDLDNIKKIYYEKKDEYHKGLDDSLDDLLYFSDTKNPDELLELKKKLEEELNEELKEKYIKKLEIFFELYPKTIKDFFQETTANIRYLEYFEGIITKYLTNKKEELSIITCISKWLVQNLDKKEFIYWLLKNYKDIIPELWQYIQEKRAEKDYKNEKFEKLLNILINYVLPYNGINNSSYILEKMENCSYFSEYFQKEILSFLRPKISVHKSQLTIKEFSEKSKEKQEISDIMAGKYNPAHVLNNNSLKQIFYFNNGSQQEDFFDAFNREELKKETVKLIEGLICLLKEIDHIENDIKPRYKPSDSLIRFFAISLKNLFEEDDSKAKNILLKQVPENYFPEITLNLITEENFSKVIEIIKKKFSKFSFFGQRQKFYDIIDLEDYLVSSNGLENKLSLEKIEILKKEIKNLREKFKDPINGYWFQSGPKYAKVIEYNEFITYEAEKHIELLEEWEKSPNEWNHNNNCKSLWKKWFNYHSLEDFKKAYEKCEEITKKRFFPVIWIEAFEALTSDRRKELDNIQYKNILERLNNLTDDNIKSIIHEICRFLSPFSTELYLQEKLFDRFLKLFERILPQIIELYKDQDNVDLGPFSDIFNNSLCLITSVLICFCTNLFQKRGIKVEDCEKYFDDLLEKVEGKKCAIYVKITFAYFLFDLYGSFPDWTKEKIIPLFYWQDNLEYNFQVIYCWKSYYSRPSLSKELFLELKKPLLKYLESIEKRGKKEERKMLFDILIFAYLSNYDIELADINGMIRKEDKISILKIIEERLSSRNELEEEKKKIYEFLKELIEKLDKIWTIEGQERYINSLIMKCLLSAYEFLKEEDWDKFWCRYVGYISEFYDISFKITPNNFNDELLGKILKKILDPEKKSHESSLYLFIKYEYKDKLEFYKKIYEEIFLKPFKE